MLAHPKVVAVGEIGLDYYYEHSPRDAQLACIEEMLGLARAHAMPVIVHCRDAWDDAAAVLAPWARQVRESFAGRPVGRHALLLRHAGAGAASTSTWAS